MEPERVLVLTEAKLQGYGMSDSSGYWWKFEIKDVEAWRELEGRKGQPFELAVILQEGEPEAISRKATLVKEAKPEKGPYGEIVKALHACGFFIAPAVCAALDDYTSASNNYMPIGHTYDEWVRLQPCAVCGGGEWVERLAIRKCEYAHIRRSDHDGTAHKGKYLGLPLCHEHHRLQHQKGESAILDLLNLKPGDDPLRTLANTYLRKWSHQKLREIFHVESLTYIAPHNWATFAKNRSLYRYLPEQVTSSSLATDGAFLDNA